MNNTNSLKIVLSVALALFTAHSAAADPAAIAQPSELTLTILHDNDLHGHILPFAYTETAVSKVEMPSVGGAARRATLIRRLRKDIKNPTLLLDSGDAFTRGPLTNAYEGIADIEAMNAVGYDVAAIGNNEFKALDGVDDKNAAGAQAALLQAVKRSRFPWVCANTVDEKGAFLEGVQPYVVRNIDGVRVGILGLTAPRSASYPQTKGWKISDPITVAKEWIPKARAHCDVLIALTHIGDDLDKKLAAQTSGLDAIVGGDSHTFLYKALEVANTDGVKVPIVQDGEFGVRLGRFDLHLLRDAQQHWHLGSYHYALLPVSKDIPEAEDVKAAVEPYVKPMLNVVGHLNEIAATPDARNVQTAQVFVDAMREQMKTDLALTSGADGFFEVFRHKDVTRYDVYAAMPFHDNVSTAQLKGSDIQDLLKKFPKTVVSGDVSHLDGDKTYSVALIDFIAHSVYKLPAASVQDTDRDSRDVVIGYLSRRG